MFSSTVSDGIRLKNWKMKPMKWSLRADFSSSFSLLTFFGTGLRFLRLGFLDANLLSGVDACIE